MNEPEDPQHARAFAAFFDADPAERFAYGLRVFLAGIRHQLGEASVVREEGGAARRRPRREPASPTAHKMATMGDERDHENQEEADR